MQPAGQGLALERNPRRFHSVIGEFREAGIALALALVVKKIGLVVAIDGPLRHAPVDRRHEVVVACVDVLARGFMRLRARLAAPRRGLERRGDIVEFPHPLADGGEIGVGLRPAGGVIGDGARLVPIHADGADDVVHQPALLHPAPRSFHAMGLGIFVRVGTHAGLLRRK